MSVRDDERGQSIQIGAVLLFGVLIISFATYQAFIVPSQNEKIESKHVDEVRQDMQELRNAIVSVPGTGADRSVTISLGTTYPARVVAVNPPPPAGNLRTLGTTETAVNLTVANARATDDEVDDLWDGRDHTFNTGGLAFQPGYNEYRSPPTVVYENSVLFESFRDDNLTTTGQTLVDGDRIRLIALNGSLARSKTGAVSVDVEALSASSSAISVTNESGSNVTVDFASRRSAGAWEDLLRGDDQWHTRAGHVYDVTETDVPDSPFRVVHLELERGETYTLQMAKVGVGTKTTGEGASYLSPVTEDGKTVQSGSSTDVVVEVRDRFNNPVSGVSVNASADQDEVASSPVTTGADGEATFQYNTSGSGSADVEFSMVGPPGSGFDANAPENATVTVEVTSSGSGNGAVSASWVSPTRDNSNGLSNCDAETCTLDVGAHGEATLTLRAVTDPAFDRLEFDFAVGNSTVGTVSPTSNTTSSDGEVTTEFTANTEGTTDVYFASRPGSDAIELVVQNMSGVSNLAPIGSFTYTDQSSPGQGNSGKDTIEYEYDWSASDQDANLATVDLNLRDSSGSLIASDQIAVSGSSATGDTTLSDSGSTQNTCGETFELEMVVTDQQGDTDTVSKTDVASC